MFTRNKGKGQVWLHVRGERFFEIALVMLDQVR
jgi:hypothetical protein